MFVVKDSPTFKTAVTFYSLKEDGTGHDENKFTAIFKRLSISQVKELTSRQNLNDEEFAREVLAGWEIMGDDGMPYPFTPENLDAQLERVGFAATITLRFTEAQRELPRKNA